MSFRLASTLLRFITVLVFSTLTLSACAGSASEAPEVRLASDGILGKRWVFIDSRGAEHAMRKCSGDDRTLLSKSCVETKNGKAQFEWHSWGDDLKSPVLRLEGRKVPIECGRGILEAQALRCVQG